MQNAEASGGGFNSKGEVSEVCEVGEVKRSEVGGSEAVISSAFQWFPRRIMLPRSASKPWSIHAMPR